MNIFVSDSNAEIAAQNLDDKRVVKMILESTQMLCTAINMHGGVAPYKSTHANHPANVWARQTKSNFDWLLRHAFALNMVYKERYGKDHKCEDILWNIMGKQWTKPEPTIGLSTIIPHGPLTPFANCAAHSGKGISFKHIDNVVDAYRAYLIERWNTDVRKPSWTHGNPPSWAIQLDNGKFLPYTEANKILFQEA